MSRAIDYYFSLVSPWSYLGHDRFISIARQHGAEVNFVPVQLGPVFSETGGLPLPKRAPHRQRYRFVELQRWREKLGLPLNLRPKFWPSDGALADCVVLALCDAGADPDGYIKRAFAGVWAREQNLADDTVLARILRESDHDPARTLKAARSEKIVRRYADNIQRTIAADVFGAPSYVLEGEVFWGQDRLGLLEDALASGRRPYTPL
jgi:2-hydroxychromene-2-carboxylate isomerase